MSVAFLSPMDNAGCLRVIASGIYGDPYEFACTYTLSSSGKTCELHGVTSRMTKAVKDAIFAELHAADVELLRFTRIKDGRRVEKLFDVASKRRIKYVNFL